MISSMTLEGGQQRVAEHGVVRRLLVRGRWWTAAAIAAGVIAALGCVLAFAGVVPSSPVTAAASQRQDVGSALGAVALVLMVVGAVRLVRAGTAGTSGWVLGEPSSRGQRARALRAVRRGEPVGEESAALTVAVAGAAVRVGKGALTLVGVTAAVAAVTLGLASWWLAGGVLAVVSLAVLDVIVIRDARAGGRWLALNLDLVVGGSR